MIRFRWSSISRRFPCDEFPSASVAVGQVKIFGHSEALARHRSAISDAVHNALVEAFAYPIEKKFQRFLPLSELEFLHPADRSENYLVIEVLLFPGRSPQAKKAFYALVLENLKQGLGIVAQDVEIVLLESARENWCIRGVPGDELTLTYRVDV